MFWIIFIVYSIIFGFSTSYIAKQKGKDTSIWFLIGVLLGIIGLLIVGFSKDEEDVNTEEYIKEEFNDKYLNENKTFNLTTNTKAPIDIIWNSIILNQNHVALYSEFKNISNTKIKSIIFEVECLNSFNKPVNDSINNLVEYTIQDLELLPNQYLSDELFIDLDHLPSTRKVNIVIKYVLFSNGDIWNYNQKDLIDTELHIINNEKDLNIIREFNGRDVISFFEMKEDRWICVCGRNNSVDLKICARCSRDKDKMSSTLTIDNIDRTIIEYTKEIDRKRKLEQEKSEKNKKLIAKRNTKKKRWLFSGILLIGLFLSTIYIFQVLLPEQRLAKMEENEKQRDIKINKLVNQQKYDELLQLYEEIIIATGIDNNIREGMLKIANKFIEMENFKNFKSTISLLENNDDEYKSSYKLILNEYQKENYENVTQLISEMNEGNLKSGYITEETTLIVGLDLKYDLMYSPINKYKQKVSGKKIIEYNNGELIDGNTYEFNGAYYGGTEIGWSENSYLYIGDTVNNKLEGKGSLYIKDYRYDENTFIKHYEGEFKNGRYDGEGVVFWDEEKGGTSTPVPEDITPMNKIINIKNPLIKATFKQGVVEGKYKRYYSDGTFNDSGKVDNGVQNSTKYGIDDKSDTHSDIKVPNDIKIVD